MQYFEQFCCIGVIVVTGTQTTCSVFIKVGSFTKYLVTYKYNNKKEGHYNKQFLWLYTKSDST